MFKILSTFLLFSAAAPAQPGAPTFLQVGTLSCAARMYTPVKLQVWCFSDSALKDVKINILTDVSDCGFSLGIADSNNYDTNTSLCWLFLSTVPNPSIPPEIPPLIPTIAWRAKITKAKVDGPVLTGTL
jgi:hypothetical protein